MRSKVNVQVLILSASVLFAAAFARTVQQESSGAAKDLAAALLQSGQRALHGDHGRVALAQGSSARSSDMSQAVEDLDLQLAINAELAGLGSTPSSSIAPARPRSATLALTQKSSGRSSDMDVAVEDLDLQLAIHAELAHIGKLQTHPQQTQKQSAPRQEPSKANPTTRAHHAAALMQSQLNEVQGDHDELDLQRAIHAELDEIGKLQTHGEWKPSPPRQAVGLLQSGHNAPQAASTAPNRSSSVAPVPLIPKVATAASAQGSRARSSNAPRTAKVAALRVADVMQKHPSASMHALPGSGKLNAWTSEYMILGRKRCVSQYFVKGVMSVLLWAALTMLIGCFYHHEKQHPPRMDPEGVNVSLHDRERLDKRSWRFGLFECTEVPSLCLFSFVCAPIRWADTMRMAGFMNFFSALLLVVGLAVLGSLSLGVGFAFLLGICVRCRQRMRKQFDIESGLCGVYTDVLAYVFCPWCSIAQEARQVEEAYLARHASVRGEHIMAQLVASKV